MIWLIIAFALGFSVGTVRERLYFRSMVDKALQQKRVDELKP